MGDDVGENATKKSSAADGGYAAPAVSLVVEKPAEADSSHQPLDYDMVSYDILTGMTSQSQQ